LKRKKTETEEGFSFGKLGYKYISCTKTARTGNLYFSISRATKLILAYQHNKRKNGNI